MMAALLTVVGGCALETESRGDFERHNMSLLEVSRQDDSILIFEAQTNGAFPEASAAAEATRMSWLEDWLEREGYCAYGYDILSRNKLGAGDINFHDMDLRYTLRCKEPPPEEAVGFRDPRESIRRFT
jgi:hypothetical protein